MIALRDAGGSRLSGDFSHFVCRPSRCSVVPGRRGVSRALNGGVDGLSYTGPSEHEAGVGWNSARGEVASLIFWDTGWFVWMRIVVHP